MNKITREHYPVEKLPEELQKEFAGFETVTLMGDREAGHASEEKPYHDYDEMMAGIKPMTWAELYADMRSNPAKYDRGVTPEEAVARIRELRDEWDHR
ncbi:hypothetical protein [Rhizobium sp.]